MGNLFKKLNMIESKIFSICYNKRVSIVGFEEFLYKFTDIEQNTLLNLLEQKLALQVSIYEKQGGSLKNVEFLESYR